MGMHASVSPYQTGIYMKSLFFFMILTPGIAAWLVLRVTGFAEVLPLSVKACLFVIYLMYIAAVKAAFSRALMFDFGLDDLLGIFGKRKESPEEKLFRDYAAMVREKEKKARQARHGEMPAEQLAFIRAVAAAAGYIECSEDMSPDIEYAVRRQLRKLSGGSEALEEQLLSIFRTRGESWAGMCFFGNDPERVSVFFGILAEIIIGDAVVSDSERSRFSEIAEHFGYSADEAINMLHDSARFRKYWDSGEGGSRSGGASSAVSYDDALRILGVKDTASSREIRKAYLRLAQRYHPDKVRNRGYSGEVMLMYQRKFEAITDAWNKVKEQRGI